jgi:acetolactate synthase-1/2/3 large subunit
MANEETSVDPNVSRRAVLGTLGALGTLASLPEPATAQGPGAPSRLSPNAGSTAHVRGVQGKMNGARAAVAALQLEGVPCVFGIPGAQNNEFWDAMKALGMPYLLVTHEASASIMADAAARATGGVGVCAVVPGPGLTNALTGLGEALLDSIPVVAIVTDVSRGPDKPAFQVHSLPNTALLRPITKAVFEIQTQAQIPATIHEAFRLARAGEPGPIGIVLPFNLLTESWDYNGIVPAPYPLPLDEDGYRKAVGLLSNRRQRVGIYAGLGCADVGPTLAAVAEVLQAPVATSVSGKGAIPDSHPLAVGWGYGAQGTRAAERAFKGVDTVLAVGVKYSEVSTANYAIPKHSNLIHVDANPDNLGRNVAASVKVHGDSRVFFSRLLADGPSIQRPPDPKLWKSIKASREEDRVENRAIRITKCVDPMHFLVNLRAQLGQEELIFIDVTASTHWASESFDVPGPRRYFTPANNQSMGWAIPAAIGAKRVRSDRQVVCVTGDGCFLMTAIELSTAARAGLAVRFFVFDDGAYHYMQMLQEPVFRRTTATELAKIHFGAFAQSVGLSYNEILHNADVPGGIAYSLQCPGPILTRVAISYEGREIRWLNAAKSAYIRRMPADQKLRMATRLMGRSIPNSSEND